MNPVQLSAPTLGDGPTNPDQAKTLRATQDFESILLGSLLRSMQQTFSGLPGDPLDAGAGDYHYLGTEALASAMARSGGFGLSRLIAANLMKSGHLTGGSR